MPVPPTGLHDPTPLPGQQGGFRHYTTNAEICESNKALTTSRAHQQHANFALAAEDGLAMASSTPSPTEKANCKWHSATSNVNCIAKTHPDAIRPRTIFM